MQRYTRREVLWGSLGASVLHAQDFPGVAYRNYSRGLPDYLRGLAKAAREKRDASLAQLTSAESVQQRQHWVRQTLTQLIGEFPEKTPLNPKVTGSFTRDGYRLDRVVYESRPNHHVPANLYVPASGKGLFPGVLFQLGHAINGKAYGSYQRACQGLARLGFLVLAFDPMGQGERIAYPDATGVGTRLAGGADGEHTVPGKQMLLTGTTCTQFQLWDAIRSLDYLASHPQVDSSRLASTGQSGGGTLSMLLAAVDDRLKTIAVFSGNTENLAAANFLPPGSTDDAEQDLVGAGPLGFDRWDLLYPFAPKPLLISISAKDSFGTYSPNYVSESWSEYRRLAKAYGMMGSPRNLQWADTPLPHGLSYDSRLVLYNWLSRHLKGQEPEIPQEPPTSPEPDAKLWVTPTGNVFKSLGSETPFQWTKKRTSIRTQKRLEDLLGVGQIEPAAVSLRKVPSTNGITIEAVDIESDVHLPAWVFHPRTASKAALIVLHPSGRNSMWTEGGLCHQLATAGLTVCAPDIRGIGDLTPEFSPGAAGYAREHELEEDYAWSSLCLGKPLLGQRVTDIIAVAKTIDTPVAIAAFGKMAIPALFAAALTPSINKIYLAGGLSSYRNIVETENYRHTFADFIPGILAQTDLPEVVAVLAPRHVIIAGAVNAAGALHPAAEVRNTYAAALERGHLEIREKAEWSAAALLQFVA